jgi:hypothetical protein
MNTHFVIGLALVLAGVLWFGGAARTDDGDKAPPGFDPEAMKKMMEMQKKLASPGEHHKAMERFVGTWDVEIRIFAMPGEAPMVTKATAEYAWLMPGLWLSQRVKGTMMGEPYEGFGIDGFDNYKKNYVSCYVQSNTSAMVHTQGIVVDPAGKVQVSYGTIDEWMTGEHDKPIKTVTRIVDADHHVVEIHDLGIGESGAAVITFSYARRK